MEAIVDGVSIQLSEAGWLENLDEWSEALAEQIATNEQIEALTEEHWNLIHLAREYFHENGMVCEPRKFSKLLKAKYGADRSSQQYIYSLFPQGLIKCTNKVAGLPRPKGCS